MRRSFLCRTKSIRPVARLLFLSPYTRTLFKFILMNHFNGMEPKIHRQMSLCMRDIQFRLILLCS
uniref:Uncharacterized protein n=1 Tax=Utricularia reniformis TaxID=192314 RepID=A0A1Y0AYV7_9LAMI|nr:hypothetical protein AEK19_MT1042 [Utricularia reniformis]ART30343.1 hypothetical protein AEK19_MT1042 [Utricularia reniformis]